MQITFLTYNIRNCRGMNGKVSIGAVAEAISRIGADVVGLQEVDRYNPRSGFVDQARRLGRLLGMHAVFGPNISLGGLGFGNAVLSGFPVAAWHNYPLPWQRQKRGLLRTEICIGRCSIAFYSTHLGLNKDERLRQVDKILSVIGQERLPMVLVGDFNVPPGASAIRRIEKVLPRDVYTDLCSTFPSVNPEHKIDYIFYSPHWRPTEQKVFDSQASDHLPLAAKLLLEP